MTAAGAVTRRTVAGSTEIRVRGLVQGVGFRPAVWRIAREYGLKGEVLNDSAGVLIRVLGPEAVIERFVERIQAEAPPLARIDGVDSTPLPVNDAFGEFRIVRSGRGEMRTQVAPDAAACPACLAEVFSPFERRFRYPFTNCTHCGPRFNHGPAAV